MSYSPTVVSIGAVCFGVVVGYVTYRTLARAAAGASISDIAAVIGAVGGGTVTVLFGNNDHSDSFGWYSIGLLGGMVLYLVLSLMIQGKEATGTVMSEGKAPLTPR